MRGKSNHKGFGHGGLRWVVLHLIAQKPRHGYELIKAIQEMTNGNYSPSAGMVYPLLTELQEKQLIRSQACAEDARKQSYQITELGNEVIDSYKEHIQEILNRINIRSQQPTLVLDTLHEFKKEVREVLAGRPLNAEEAEIFIQTLKTAAATLQQLKLDSTMTTSTATLDKKPYRVRHQLKFRIVTVQEVLQISPSLIRIVFQGDDLSDFKSDSFDDHAKLFFPDAATGRLIKPEMTEQGLKFADDIKPISRDYTPRLFDLDAKTLAIDFVIHDAGPATEWAQHAKIGDQIAIGGPRGSMVIPMVYQHYVLIGDDTALPAIARRLEELPASAQATVVVEVNSSVDEITFKSAAKTQITWLHREGQASGQTTLFKQALESLSLPQHDYFIWIAAETQVARQLRKTLVEQYQVAKDAIKAAGYWQHGTSNAHTVIDDE
ncbi:SIP domain-containing protein [Acinetobacter sp. MB5]|uniref:SIP domain-containing protein n=1 Tax=Acinetobacter sp. MB5 TaxID=2069438 RepID=UPI000DD0769B|nr:SIP domain-containing protein [Acinetobacter sp. MB5]